MRRFEREVQLTSELTDPNTIAIFDYGRTPEGLFYYVMEYLEGLSLERAGRSVRPATARARGPHPEAGVRLSRRGACARARPPRHQARQHHPVRARHAARLRQSARLRPGQRPQRPGRPPHKTSSPGRPPIFPLKPLPIPTPSALRATCTRSARSGTYLLTGEEVFERKSIVELLRAQLLDPPAPPHERLGAPVPEALEHLIMDCLDKDPANRPPSARCSSTPLDEVELPQPWTEDEARIWWTNHRQTGADRGSRRGRDDRGRVAGPRPHRASGRPRPTGDR